MLRAMPGDDVMIIGTARIMPTPFSRRGRAFTICRIAEVLFAARVSIIGRPAKADDLPMTCRLTPPFQRDAAGGRFSAGDITFRGFSASTTSLAHAQLLSEDAALSSRAFSPVVFC